MPGLVDGDLTDPQNLLAEGVIDRVEVNEAAEKKRKMMVLEKQYHIELNMELKGITYSTSLSTKNELVSVMLPYQLKLLRLRKVLTLIWNKLKRMLALSTISMSCEKKRLIEAIEIRKKREKGKNNLGIVRKKKAKANTNE